MGGAHEGWVGVLADDHSAGAIPSSAQCPTYTVPDDGEESTTQAATSQQSKVWGCVKATEGSKCKSCIMPKSERTSARNCASCNPGHRLSGDICVPTVSTGAPADPQCSGAGARPYGSWDGR